MPLIYQLGECLNELEDAQIWLAHKTPTVFITNSAEAREVLDLAGIVYDGEKRLDFVKWRRSRSVWREHCIFQNFQMFSVNATR